MVCVISLNPDGTAAVTTPVAQPGESDADALARVLAVTPGGEPLSAELANGLIASARPTPTATVPVGRMRAVLSLLAVRLPTLDTAGQQIWGPLIDRLTALLPREFIEASDLLPIAQAAKAAGLLTDSEMVSITGSQEPNQ